MGKIPTTTMRLDPELKEAVKPILEELGLNLTTAVTMFLKALVREGGIPFEVKDIKVSQLVEEEILNDDRA